MYNAANKLMAVAVVCLAAAASCADKDRQGAEALVAQTEAALENHNYQGALVLLDTLNARYPEQTAIRRGALRLRASAMEGIALDSIAVASEQLAETTLAREACDQRFRHVDSSVGLEGYFIPKGAPEKVMTATGIQPRVSDKGFFYIVVNVQGRSIGLNAIEFVDGASSIASQAISPARIVKVEGSESASFNPEELEGVGAWLKEHPGTSKLIIKGSKGSVNVKIDDRLRNQLADCYDYSQALQAQRRASIHREKYERMLSTARDQLANLPLPQEEN